MRESEAGWTQRELQELLRVRVQVLLLEAVRQEEIRRETVAGLYLYLHRDPSLGERQLQRRQERVAAARPSAEAGSGVDDEIIIHVWALYLTGVLSYGRIPSGPISQNRAETRHDMRR